MRYFIYSVIGIVAVAVVAGFFIVGSPERERVRRFDERRVQDLQTVQGEIVNFWQSKQKLPEKLSALKDDIRGFTPPTDPQTGAEYGYEVRGPETFTLCTTFSETNVPSAVSVPKTPMPARDPYYWGANWEHGAGYVCFERTIDKDLYPSIRKP